MYGAATHILLVETFLQIRLSKSNLVVVNYLSYVEFRKSSFLECSMYDSATHIYPGWDSSVD